LVAILIPKSINPLVENEASSVLGTQYYEESLISKIEQ